MVCLDIGSNIGYYTILENKLVGNNGKIISIEPSPLNFECLQKNIKLQANNSIQAFNFAASDKNGKLDFFINSKSNWSKVLEKNEKPHSDGKIISVLTKTIDSFLTENNFEKIDFIRMDVEGYEYNIFNGMRDSLKKFKPILMIEIHKDIMTIPVTTKFLHEIENHFYEVQYFIPRGLDYPILADEKFIKTFTIKELINKCESNSLPSVFTLLLKHV